MIKKNLTIKVKMCIDTIISLSYTYFVTHTFKCFEAQCFNISMLQALKPDQLI